MYMRFQHDVKELLRIDGDQVGDFAGTQAFATRGGEFEGMIVDCCIVRAPLSMMPL